MTTATSQRPIENHPLYKRLSRLGTLVFNECGLRTTFHKPLNDYQDWIFWGYGPGQKCPFDLMGEFVNWLDKLPDDDQLRRPLAERWREVCPDPGSVEQSLLYQLLELVGTIHYKPPTQSKRGIIRLCDSSIKSWNFKSKADAVRQLARMLMDGVQVGSQRIESVDGKIFRKVLERFVERNRKAQPFVQRELIDGYNVSPESTEDLENPEADLRTLAKYLRQQELHGEFRDCLEVIYKLNDPNDPNWIVLHKHAARIAIELQDITGAEIIVSNAIATTSDPEQIKQLEWLIPSIAGV